MMQNTRKRKISSLIIMVMLSWICLISVQVDSSLCCTVSHHLIFEQFSNNGSFYACDYCPTEMFETSNSSAQQQIGEYGNQMGETEDLFYFYEEPFSILSGKEYFQSDLTRFQNQNPCEFITFYIHNLDGKKRQPSASYQYLA